MSGLVYTPAVRVGATREATDLAAQILDLAVRISSRRAMTVPLEERHTLLRAGQTLRLVAQLVIQGTYDLELGRAWLDAAALLERRAEESAR